MATALKQNGCLSAPQNEGLILTQQSIKRLLFKCLRLAFGAFGPRVELFDKAGRANLK